MPDKKNLKPWRRKETKVTFTERVKFIALLEEVDQAAGYYHRGDVDMEAFRTLVQELIYANQKILDTLEKEGD